MWKNSFEMMYSSTIFGKKKELLCKMHVGYCRLFNSDTDAHVNCLSALRENCFGYH